MEDLISKLPDELLQQILLKVSTRDSVRTSLLSSRWRNLWKSVPGLNLIGDVYTNLDVIDFLNRFLALHKETPIQQFTLICKNKNYNDVHGFSLKWLIGEVITRGVQCFAIDGSNYAGFGMIRLPVSLYKCETLVHLWLETVKLNDCKFINLPRLETMHLDSVLLCSDVVLEELLLCSPVLQALSIHYTTLGHLTLRSQTVKRLSLRRCSSSSSSDGGVVIDIPSLEILCIREDLLEKFRLESASSSIKMYLDVGAGAGEQAFHNFNAGFSGVTDLSISSNILQGPHCPPQQLPHFENLTHLNACLRSGFSEMLPMFLSRCPNLKSLDLWLYGYPNMKEIASSPVPQCLQTSIEYIDLIMSPHARQERSQKAEIEFVKYILENATVLKKLTLWLDGAEDESSSVLQRILTFPNRSLSLVEVKMNQRPARFLRGYGFEFKLVFDPNALFYLS